MFSSRGVQYVHCVMHKCIMVKVGREIWESRGNERFGGNRGNWGERTKIGGNFKFVTKNGHKNLYMIKYIIIFHDPPTTTHDRFLCDHPESGVTNPQPSMIDAPVYKEICESLVKKLYIRN